MFNLDFLLMMFGLLFLLIFVLIGVSFLTLMERKVLGYIQYRKGSNKISVFGVFQPFGDAIKLFSKEQIFLYMSNFVLYYYFPLFGLLFSLLFWFCIPFIFGGLSFNLGVMYFLCISSLGVYFLMASGWSSNSIYSLLGSLRAVAQMISYEVVMMLYLICFLIVINSLSFIDFVVYQYYLWLLFLCYPVCLVWIAIMMAETNRSPFDFSEGESELVSGFNVEYGSIGFSLIFMGEYSSIIFMSFIFVIIFFSSSMFNLFFYIKVVFLSFIFIWIRGSLPRFRYDKLMSLAWKVFLPIVLNILMFFFCMKFGILLLSF